MKQLLSAAAALTLACTPSYAILIDSTISNLGLGGSGNKTIISGFNPGGSDKMVIILGAEHGFSGNIGGNFNSVSLNGVPLTPVVQEGSGVPTIAIFYMDYPAATAGIGDLVVNQENHNQSIYSIYLLSDTAPGVGASHAEWGAGDNSIDLTTTTADSLVLVGHENAGPNGGNGAGNSSANAPLFEDTPYLEVGNTWTSLSTAHAFVATPGTATYSYTGDDASDLIAMAAVEIISGGPPPALTLQVNTVTGEMMMIGDDEEAVTMNYYQITSAGNSLSRTGWQSLADQDYEGNGPANGSGNGWEEGGGSGAHALAEAYLLGDSTIAIDELIDMGFAYNTSVDAQDLIFTYRTELGRQFEGVIEYISTATPGDTDSDGDVDDSDLGTSFANYTGPVGAAGGKTFAQGDTDGDGDVDDSDLGTIFSNYTGPLGPANVPEPASAALLVLGGLQLLRRRR